jgi:hypothetical protein
MCEVLSLGAWRLWDWGRQPSVPYVPKKCKIVRYVTKSTVLYWGTIFILEKSDMLEYFCTETCMLVQNVFIIISESSRKSSWISLIFCSEKYWLIHVLCSVKKYFINGSFSLHTHTHTHARARTHIVQEWALCTNEYEVPSSVQTKTRPLPEWA